MDDIQPQLHDRYNLELFCQHCGHYLTMFVGIVRTGLPAKRRELRQAAQAHANSTGHEVEICLYLTLVRRVWFTPAT